LVSQFDEGLWQQWPSPSTEICFWHITAPKSAASLLRFIGRFKRCVILFPLSRDYSWREIAGYLRLIEVTIVIIFVVVVVVFIICIVTVVIIVIVVIVIVAVISYCDYYY